MIRGIIAILKGKKTPQATAAGIALGAILGLLPKENLFPFLFFLIFFLTTIDKPAAILASLIFTPIGFLLDPLANKTGLLLLTPEALEGFWTALYNLPIIPWTKFNNTAVLGQLLLGIVLFAPLYLAAKRLMTYYQKNIKPSIEKFKAIQALKALKICQWWTSISQ